MAYTDKTRVGTLAQKKSIAVFSGVLTEGEEILAASGNYLLAKLPPESVILDASIFVKTASDAATSAIATLGTAEGGTQILSAANLKTAGKVGTFTGRSATGTGVDLYLGITISGAATAVGEYIVIIEYLEYEKNTGEYTEITRY